MQALREELLNPIHWEETYTKMSLKQGFSKDDIDLIWKLKEIYKEDIVEEIMTGMYIWGIPRKVEIAKSESKKKRVVYVYDTKDRYVLGVLYRAVSARFKDKISDSCFSYKKGTGTSNAIQYIKDNRKDNFKYGVKVDIHAYFNSVSREKVIEMIKELFTGPVQDTFTRLMLNDEVDWKGEVIEEWKSLIPGCALGSFFANYTMKECDEYFDNEDCIYARYSDDIIVISDNVDKLHTYLDKINYFLSKYNLTMNPDKYTWFEPGDSIEYLGLSLNDDGVIDISKHSKQKIKKQIHRWCRKGRMEIERDYKSFNSVAKKIIRKLNNKNFFCLIHNNSTFGWAMYAFPKITTIQSLIEIDNYTKDTIRALKTGKHNKANFKAISDEEFKELGLLSLVELYYLYKNDYDYFMEVIELHCNIR